MLIVKKVVKVDTRGAVQQVPSVRGAKIIGANYGPNGNPDFIELIIQSAADKIADKRMHPLKFRITPRELSGSVIRSYSMRLVTVLEGLHVYALEVPSDKVWQSEPLDVGCNELALPDGAFFNREKPIEFRGNRPYFFWQGKRNRVLKSRLVYWFRNTDKGHDAYLADCQRLRLFEVTGLLQETYRASFKTVTSRPSKRPSRMGTCDNWNLWVDIGLVDPPEAEKFYSNKSVEANFERMWDQAFRSLRDVTRNANVG